MIAMRGREGRSRRLSAVLGVAATLVVAVVDASQRTRVAQPHRLAEDLLLLSLAGRASKSQIAVDARAIVDSLTDRDPSAELWFSVTAGGTQLVWDHHDGTVTHDLGPGIASFVRRVIALERLEEVASKRPVATGALMAGLRSAAGQAAVEGMFAATMSKPPLGSDRGGRSWYESGGLLFLEVTVEGATAHLLTIADSVHAFANELRAARADATKLNDLRHSSPLSFIAVDPNGLLAARLDRIGSDVASERDERVLTLLIDTLLQNVASSFMFDRPTLLAHLVDHELPPGRLVGLWHSHPGYPSGAPPSLADQEVARSRGRFVTFVFRRDGFDVYDLRGKTDLPPGALRATVEVRPDGWGERGWPDITAGSAR